MLAIILAVGLLQGNVPTGGQDLTISFHNERIPFVSAQALSLSFEGFRPEDLIEIRRGPVELSGRGIVLGSAAIKAGVLIHETKSYSLSRVGSVLVLKPSTLAETAIISMIIPTGVLVTLDFNGRRIANDVPEVGVFLHNNAVQSAKQSPLVQSLMQKAARKELEIPPTNIVHRDLATGYGFLWPRQAKLLHREHPILSREEVALLRGKPLAFRVTVSEMGQVIDAKLISGVVPQVVLQKIIETVRRYRYEPLVVDGKNEKFVTDLPWVLTVQ